MNRKQLTILLVGIALLILSELFLPWHYNDGMTSAQRSAGYHFFTTKPPHKNGDELRHLFAYPEGHSGDPENAQLTLNSGRLKLQRLFLSLFTWALIIFCKSRKSVAWWVLGACVLLPGLFFLALWVLGISAEGF